MLPTCKTIKFPAIAPVELGFTLLFCLFTGLAIATGTDLKLSYRIAMGIAFFTGVAFIILPHKKTMLLIGWFFIHPLSIEKVFQVGSPLIPDFTPPALVISGSDIILVMLCLTLLFESLVLQRRHIWYFHKAMTPLLLFAIWNFIVFMIRPATPNSILAIIHIIKMLLFILIMVSVLSSEKHYKIALQTIAAAVAIQVVIVFYSAFSGDIFRFSSKITNTIMTFSGTGAGQSHIRATGTMGHVNQEASFLTFFSLPLLGLPFVTSRFKALGIWLILGGSTLAIILTFSRSAWLSLVFACIILTGLAFHHRLLSKTIWVYLFPFIFLGIISFPVLGSSVVDRIVHGDDGATSSRIRAIKLALDLTRKHPIIGVGPNLFIKTSLDYYPPHQISNPMHSAYSPINENSHRFGRIEISQIRIGSKIISVPLPVHNKFLLVLSELGVVGLFIFLWFQYRIFYHIRQTLQQTQGSATWMAIGLMAAFGASLVYMNLDLFSDDKSMQILLIIPVLAMALNNITLQRNEE